MGFEGVVKLSKIQVDSNLNMQNFYTIINTPPPTDPDDVARLSDLLLSKIIPDLNKNMLGYKFTNLGAPVASTDSARPDMANQKFINLAAPVAANDSARNTDLPKVTALEYVIDGGGSAISAGEKGHLVVPFACTITEVQLEADQPGSIKVDIWKDTYANFPPTDADTICGGNEPEISGAQKHKDTTLTGWIKSISVGGILAFNVDSCTTITRVTIVLKVLRT